MRIIILSKAPVPGKVKTRLLTRYTVEQAAKLHEQMASTVIKKALKVCSDIWLAVDDIKHPFFMPYANHPHIKLFKQSGGELGERLARLHRQSLSTDNQAILFLGTDSPHISPDRYYEANAQLKAHDIVIGPVEDGGYDLIGLKVWTPTVFQNINWGTATVFEETIHTINDLGLSVKALDMSFDLDRPQDIDRAPPHTW